MKSPGEIGPLGLALLGAALWGFSGTASQVLFQVYDFPTVSLMAIRCLVSGIIILSIFRPKWPSADALQLGLFSVLGILPSQIFFFITIATSNVVTALLLQFLFFPMIVVYETLTGRFKLNAQRALMLALTAVGTMMIILEGSGTIRLSISPLTLACGILSAFGVAYYNLSSPSLTKKYGSWQITGWGFLIVGLISLIPGMLSLSHAYQASWSQNMTTIVGLILIVTILGTILAYGLILLALTKLSASEISIATTTEPVFAAVISYFVFGSLLSGLQYAGGILMLLSVALLQLSNSKKR